MQKVLVKVLYESKPELTLKTYETYGLSLILVEQGCEKYSNVHLGRQRPLVTRSVSDLSMLGWFVIAFPDVFTLLDLNWLAITSSQYNLEQQVGQQVGQHAYRRRWLNPGKFRGSSMLYHETEQGCNIIVMNTISTQRITTMTLLTNYFCFAIYLLNENDKTVYTYESV